MMNVQFTKLKNIFSVKNVGTYFLLGAFVLMISTYGAYRLQKYVSQINNGDIGNDKIEVRVSDRSCDPSISTVACPLTNSLSSTDAPFYNYFPTSDGPTALPGGKTFRIQGEVYYRAK